MEACHPLFSKIYDIDMDIEDMNLVEENGYPRKIITNIENKIQNLKSTFQKSNTNNFIIDNKTNWATFIYVYQTIRNSIKTFYGTYINKA